MDLSKPILITGATGYVGSHFLNELLSQGAPQVYCLSSKVNLPEGFPFWIECDITNRNRVFEVFQAIKPTYVFHFAALGAKTTQTVFTLEELSQVNNFGTQNLIDAAIDSGVCEGFINVSTSYEYGPYKNPISEITDFLPYGDYASSKHAGSMYLDEKVRSTGFPGITYRLFSVYGPGDSGRIIPLIVDALKTKKTLHLFDVYRKRDFVHKDTVISALLKFDKIRKSHINSVNIGSGESLTIYELVHALSRILNLPISDNIIFGDDSLPDTHWKCDPTLLKRFIQPIGLEKGLLQTLKY